jgi:hypothetical protein
MMISVLEYCEVERSSLPKPSAPETSYYVDSVNITDDMDAVNISL